MTQVRFLHVGGPTLMIEFGGWRLLTDPTFDEAGRTYAFGLGTSSRKVVGPAVASYGLGPVDAVLLSHDHHADNLDDAGRTVLARATEVVTTAAGARRLGGGARGLHPWDSTTLDAPGRPSLEVTATPARHGPPFSRPLVGHVVGFALRWAGQQNGALWISGDTVLHRGVRQVADRLPVGTAVLHLGGVRFPATGPLRYTMTGRDAARLCRRLRPATVLPVHYEGWSHFRDGREHVQRAFDAAPREVRQALRWLPRGHAVELTV